MSDLPNWLITLLIGGALGLIVGVFAARRSAAQKPIKGGPVASVFHYLGASAFIAVAPTVLCGVFVYRLPFLGSVGLGVGLLALVAVCLVVYGVFEVRATR
jgi:uncharacterized membrane protein